MTRYYKVAEHVFALSMPQGHPLWGMLSQYAPFEVPEAGEPIFELTLVPEVSWDRMTMVYDGSPEPEQPLVRLFDGIDAWGAEYAPVRRAPVAGRLRMDKAFRKGSLQILSKREALFALNNALMLMFAFRTATEGTLEMHASVTVNSGKAFLFLAKSGTGKSTHSRLWLDNIPGSSLLNDDNPVVRIFPDGKVIVYGSPWSGKTPCYKNEQYPAGAFVQIRRCPENKITRMNLFESYALLYGSSSGFKADKTMADGLHDSFSKIAGISPCYVLDCTPDPEAAFVCSKEVLG